MGLQNRMAVRAAEEIGCFLHLEREARALRSSRGCGEVEGARRCPDCAVEPLRPGIAGKLHGLDGPLRYGTGNDMRGSRRQDRACHRRRLSSLEAAKVMMAGAR